MATLIPFRRTSGAATSSLQKTLINTSLICGRPSWWESIRRQPAGSPGCCCGAQSVANWPSTVVDVVRWHAKVRQVRSWTDKEKEGVGAGVGGGFVVIVLRNR